MRLNLAGLTSVEHVTIDLGFKTLKTRRILIHTTLVHKILNSDIHFPESLYKMNLKVPTFNSSNYLTISRSLI